MESDCETLAYPICLDGCEEGFAIAAVDVHDAIVSQQGFNPECPDELRDEIVGKICSVVMSAFGTFFGSHPRERYDDVFDQIADFATHMAKDHIFPDGNKRTTVTMSIAALYFAGFILQGDDAASSGSNMLYQWIQDVVSGEKSRDDLARALRENSLERR